MKTALYSKDFGVLAESFLSRDVKFRFTLTGGSMTPFMKEGDEITVARARKQCAVGDVVLVRAKEGRVLLHRIVKKCPNGYITRGDACMTDDGCIPEADIMGKVVAVSSCGLNLHLRLPFKYLIGRFLGIVKAVFRLPLVSLLKPPLVLLLR